MPVFRNNSIRKKLVVTVGVAVICGVMLASLASAWREANRHFQAKQNEITGIAAALAVPLAPELAAGNQRGIAVALNAIGRIKSVNYARVLTNEGGLVYEIGTGILISRGDQGMTAVGSFGPLDAIYFGAYPFRADIVHRGQPIGALEIIVDLSDLQNALWISIGQSLLFGIIAAIFGMLASSYLQRRIAEPIVALTSAAKHVQSAHDFSYRAERQSSDETGDLVDAFNAMLFEIEARDHALTEHRDKLELTVQERTADLVVAKEEADRANAAKSDFLATMSHEIRTPMNGMLATAELLTSAQLPARQQRYAEIIMRSGRSLLAIINDILDLAKVEAGKLELEQQPVELATLADDVLQLFWERANDNGVDLCAYISPAVPNAIAGDPVRLNQILANLINNALKFTEAGHVLVRMDVLEASGAKGLERHIEISVQDTGIGIATDKLDNIFGSFVQADSAVSRNYGGTGIGLSICKKLADAMGGDLRASSVLGQGSTFTLALPLNSKPDREHWGTDIPHEAKTAVVLHKPGATRTALETYLGDVGYSVTCYDDEDTALSLSASPDILFADVETCRTLNSGEGLTRPEIVIGISLPNNAAGPSGTSKSVCDLEVSYPLSLAELRPLFQAMSEGRHAVRQLATEAPSAQSSPILRYDGVRALAADDNPVNREILSEALERMGIETHCVEDGGEVVRAYRQEAFDVVFMDVSMPVLDGYEATAGIRQYEEQTQSPRTPIIALTAHAYGSEANLWRQSGMDACVTKPFTLGSLQNALSDFLFSSDHDEGYAASQSTNPEQTDAAGRSNQQNNLPQILDLDVLAGISEMQRDGDNLVERIIGLYAEHAPKALQQLLQLTDTTDCQTVAAAAHALKSLSR
ncbi:MAG: ATP-binding protein, partial [Pseudomonadota bacterium]